MSDKERLEGNEISREELRDLIEREGYVTPEAMPADPELRTGNYCAAAYSFEFVKEYLEKAGKKDLPHVIVLRYKVAGGKYEEFATLLVNKIRPMWSELAEKGLITNVTFTQLVYGSGFTHEVSFELPSSAEVFKVKREFDTLFSKLPVADRESIAKKLDGIVQDFESAVLEKIPVSLPKKKA